MKTIIVNVDELIESDTIAFGDSEGMIEDRLDEGLLSFDEYDDLMTTMDKVETKKTVLHWKFEECSQDFVDSIVNDGILTPVAMLDDTILNGHHRLAVAQKLGINVPIDVYESWGEFETLHNWSDGMSHSDMQEEVSI